MRKLKLQMQITIDGFVVGPEGQMDWMWLSKPDSASFQWVIDLADTCDTILLGRKMTPEFIAHWENVFDNEASNPRHALSQRMVNMRKIAFSRTLAAIQGRNLEVENGDLVTAVNALKAAPGKDILVYGGADFVSALVKHDLIDAYYLIVNPVAIGSGKSIFRERKVLTLERSIAFESGKIINEYLPVRG